MPLYLSVVVNMHQRGWGSITPFVIGIVSPGGRLVIEFDTFPVRRSTGPPGALNRFESETGQVSNNQCSFPIDGHHRKRWFRPGERIMPGIWTLKERTRKQDEQRSCDLV